MTDLIDEIIQQVTDNLNGRFANAGNNARHLLEAVSEAGDGNYLEIGVMHGGSLCSVALLKKALGHTGICIGVDPLDGYYAGRTGKEYDPHSGVPVNIETVQDNIARFELDNVALIPVRSQLYATNKRLAVTYIDGDHTQSAVYGDWIRFKDNTTHFMVFHDYMNIKGVTRACRRAELDPEWDLYLKRQYTFILRRLNV